MRPLLLMVVLLAGCGAPKGAVVEPMAPWRTEAGARALKVEMLETFLDQGATAAAHELIRQLRADGDTSAQLDLYQAMALQQEAFYGEAERILLEYRKREPRDPRALKALGLLYADTGRTGEAVASYQQAVALDEADAEAWNNLGFLLLADQRPAEALEALQQAVALDGTVKKYRNNLGFALAANGRWRQAFEAFQSAGRTDQAHYNLGVAYELDGDAPQALRHYQKAVEYNPKHTTAQEAVVRLAPSEAPPQEE